MKFGFTEWFVLIVLGTVLIVDLILEITNKNETISSRFVVWSMRYPIISLLLGIVIGHLAWPNFQYCQ